MVIFAVFAVLVLLFVILPLIGWAIWQVISAAIIGAIFGALGRLLLPGHQPIGVFATICCGWVGSIVGILIGHAAGLPWAGTVLIEIGAAAGAVAILSRSQHGRVGGGRPRGVLDR
jgi:uncharacterized membrane protein YeaQ/YmgE (transglycosylase-associated protein family)